MIRTVVEVGFQASSSEVFESLGTINEGGGESSLEDMLILGIS